MLILLQIQIRHPLIRKNADKTGVEIQQCFTMIESGKIGLRSKQSLTVPLNSEQGGEGYRISFALPKIGGN